jgi:hypothetical protein
VVFEHANAFRQLHRALLSNSGDAIHDELRDRIQRLVRREIVEKRIRLPKMELDYAVQFLAGALLGVLAWWTTTETGLSPSDADDLFQRLAEGGVGDLVARPDH